MRALLRPLCLAALLLPLTACVGDMDNPSKVVDLRVLGIQTSPPELMAPTCDLSSPQALVAYLPAVDVRVLLDDPQGMGRPVHYELFACPSQGDRTCEEERVVLQEQTELPGGVQELPGGELTVRVAPAVAMMEDGETLLLQRVAEEDRYKGLGGIRVPLVLHVWAGEEEVWAQKLMVYSCRRFEGQQANENPELPGLTLDGQPWEVDALPEKSGAGPLVVEPLDFSAREVSYVVPSLGETVEPVTLKESWQLSWHTDYGRFEPVETGGALAGDAALEGRHRVEWLPPAQGAEPRERVRVWAVVRDGRGGQSWLERSFRYTP